MLLLSSLFIFYRSISRIGLNQRKESIILEVQTHRSLLLTLIGISGEIPPDLLERMGISESYGEKLITLLKREGYIKTHYRDKLRGYRLTAKGKKLLLSQNPNRFSFYLTGSSDTNQPRSDLPRRLRLHHGARVWLFMKHIQASIYRDKKPALFSQTDKQVINFLPFPSFYHSREIKELGIETTKINNSRTLGVLFAKHCMYVVFYTGNSVLKWEYRTEIRMKALLSYHVFQGILKNFYRPDTPIHALFIGSHTDVGVQLLTSTGGYRNSCFKLDTSFEHFYFLPDSLAGETILQVLCNKSLANNLIDLLLSDLEGKSDEIPFEHDAMKGDNPVLLAYDFDLSRLSRFVGGLSRYHFQGNLICFDFQKKSLLSYCGERVTITTIDLHKFERRFL